MMFVSLRWLGWIWCQRLVCLRAQCCRAGVKGRPVARTAQYRCQVRNKATGGAVTALPPPVALFSEDATPRTSVPGSAAPADVSVLGRSVPLLAVDPDLLHGQVQVAADPHRAGVPWPQPVVARGE